MRECKKGLPKELRETLKFVTTLKNKNFKQCLYYRFSCSATNNLECHLLFSEIDEKLVRALQNRGSAKA